MNLSASLKLTDKVFFIGSVKNPYPYIKAAKFLVLCSLYEGLPTVLIEALILQTPIISTDCPSGPKEITRFYSEQALVHENFNVEKLAEKISQFSLNAPLVDENCMDQFDSKNISNAYLQLIDSCNKSI